MSENIKFKFAAEHLPRLALFMAQKDIRYYLNGIYIEPAKQGGVYLVACDGHTMAVIYDKDGMIEGAQSAIMRATPGLIAACKKTKSAAGAKQLLAVGKRVSVAYDFDQENTPLEEFVQGGEPWIDGTYPAWRKVMPDFDKLSPGMTSSAINAQYLARCAKIDKRGFGIHLWQSQEKGPVVVQHIGVPEMVTIIMPMHDDSKGFRSRFDQFKEAA